MSDARVYRADDRVPLVLCTNHALLPAESLHSRADPDDDMRCGVVFFHRNQRTGHVSVALLEDQTYDWLLKDFGGWREARDASWFETAARELREETLGLLPSLRADQVSGAVRTGQFSVTLFVECDDKEQLRLNLASIEYRDRTLGARHVEHLGWRWYDVAVLRQAVRTGNLSVTPSVLRWLWSWRDCVKYLMPQENNKEVALVLETAQRLIDLFISSAPPAISPVNDRRITTTTTRVASSSPPLGAAASAARQRLRAAPSQAGYCRRVFWDAFGSDLPAFTRRTAHAVSLSPQEPRPAKRRYGSISKSATHFAASADCGGRRRRAPSPGHELRRSKRLRIGTPV